MTFEKKFPSLKGALETVDYQGIPEPFLVMSSIEDFCLDKQKVLDAIGVLIMKIHLSAKKDCSLNISSKEAQRLSINLKELGL